MGALSAITPLPGVTVEVHDRYARLSCERPLRTLSTAPAGPGLADVQHFLNLLAPPALDCDAPEVPVQALVAELGLEGPVAGFLTAVEPRNTILHLETDESRGVLVMVTVGVANATRPGDARFDAYTPGTINTVVIIDAALDDTALAEALALTAETKALTLLEAGVRTRTGLPASGTSTDAYAIATSGRGPAERYAGSVSPVGFLVGKAVRAAITAGLPAAMARAAAAGDMP